MINNVSRTAFYLLTTFALLSICTCSDSDKSVNPDPDESVLPVNDLATGLITSQRVVLTWTAPDTALEYDIRYSKVLIDTSNWLSADTVSGEPEPLTKGSIEHCQITGLDSAATYFIAIKFKIDSTEWSEISNVATCLTAAFDSQGKIVFNSEVDGYRKLMVFNPDGTELVSMLNNDSTAFFPVWDVFASNIIFQSNSSGFNKLHKLEIETGTEVNLSGSNIDYNPACNQSGGTRANILFTHNPSGPNTEIWTMDLDGGSRAPAPFLQLVEFLISDSVTYFEPATRYDQFGCVFKMYDFNSGTWSLYTAPFSGGDPELIASMDTLRFQHSRPSPDGTQIVFHSNYSGNYEIYLMDITGANITNITNNNADDMDAWWSPDGTKLVFSSDRDGDSEIYVMDTVGNNVVQLTDNEVPDKYPCWSHIVNK